MVKVIRVRIADYAVLQEIGMLMTIGLGSCVGIAAYDSQAKVAGLAHILLPDSSRFPKGESTAKFADTAVPLLISEMLRAGADRGRIRAKIAGGSEMFSTYKKDLPTVGSLNIIAVKRALTVARIPLLAEALGGNAGRTMHVHVADCRVFITIVGESQKEI